MMKAVMCSAVIGLAVMAGSAQAQSQKERDCAIQGQVMGAVQQARLDGVRKNKLVEAVKASNPDLSQKVLDTIPAIGGHIYTMKKRDLKKIDLGDIAQTQCLENYEQIQALQNSISN